MNNVTQLFAFYHRVQLYEDEVETWILIGDPSCKHPSIHCKRYETIPSVALLLTRRSRQAEEKRAARKGRAASTNSTAPTHLCSTCGRGFLAQIGLISHLRTHQRI